MLDRSTSLPNGLRVRFRLPHGTDRAGLRDLHGRAGVPIDDVAVTRLLRVDPRRRAAVIATAWDARGETVVGFACGDLDAQEPDVLVADEVFGPQLRALLARAIRLRASRVA